MKWWARETAKRKRPKEHSEKRKERSAASPSMKCECEGFPKMCLVERRELVVFLEFVNLLELALAEQADHRDGVAVLELLLGRGRGGGR